MSEKISCFVAYPSEPPSLAESVEAFIQKLHNGQLVNMQGWKSTSVGGKFVMVSICKAINQNHIFICDLTTLNHNVLFELGYAIARNKRIWIFLNPNIETSTNDYKKFRLLTTIGYCTYSNSHQIEEAFYKDRPYEDLENTILKQSIEAVEITSKAPTILYLKSAIETDASIKLSRKVHASSFQDIVDDPNEVRIRTLSWYTQEVSRAYGVIAHFLGQDHRGARLHNAKNSLVSGMAYGLGKRLLMLAHEPNESPIDYRELFKIHRTASECEHIAQPWLNSLEQEFKDQQDAIHVQEEDLRGLSELQRVSLGDPVAEYESEKILDYFVNTAAYTEALTSTRSIIVGRKGSGKTAILLKLADALQSDSRNHIVIIRPIAYELEAILRMLRQALDTSEKGYLTESFWKFLIYTELAKSAFDVLKSKPTYYQFDLAETQLLEFVDKNAKVITPEFSVRLETIVNRLEKLEKNGSIAQQRTRISEFLHNEIITHLRKAIGNVLQKKNKVVILIDNLDKAWKERTDLPELCQFLLGLLGVSQRIADDFKKSDHWRRPINLSLILFLRDDIFAQVMKYARERDKLSYSRISWEDKETLLRVLEQRFLTSTNSLSSSNEVWSKYFCPTVSGITTRDYIAKSVIPRPRDLLIFSKAALAQAINRGHSVIIEDDILEARKRYSYYALDSLVVESEIQIEKLEALLYEFVGCSEVVTSTEILEKMKKCGISEPNLSLVLDLLCDLNFLGREVGNNRFEFQTNEENKSKLQVMARKVYEGKNDAARFLIGEPFHPYLEIVKE